MPLGSTSLYTGEIDFVPIPDGFATYWILPLKSMSITSFLPTDDTTPL